MNVVGGDVTDGTLIDRALGEYEIDSVFHLAAQTIVGTANRSPLPTWEANVRGTWMVLEGCRRHEIPRVVVAALGQGLRRPRRAALPRGLRAGAALPL